MWGLDAKVWGPLVGDFRRKCLIINKEMRSGRAEHGPRATPSLYGASEIKKKKKTKTQRRAGREVWEVLYKQLKLLKKNVVGTSHISSHHTKAWWEGHQRYRLQPLCLLQEFCVKRFWNLFKIKNIILVYIIGCGINLWTVILFGGLYGR